MSDPLTEEVAQRLLWAMFLTTRPQDARPVARVIVRAIREGRPLEAIAEEEGVTHLLPNIRLVWHMINSGGEENE